MTQELATVLTILVTFAGGALLGWVLHSRLAGLRAEGVRQSVLLQRAQADLTRLEHETRATREQVSVLRSEKAALEARVSRVSGLETSLAQAQEDLTKANEGRVAAVGRAERVLSIEAALAQLGTELSSVREAHAKAREELADVTGRLGEEQKAREAQRLTLETAQSALAKVREDLATGNEVKAAAEARADREFPVSRRPLGSLSTIFSSFGRCTPSQRRLSRKHSLDSKKNGRGGKGSAQPRMFYAASRTPRHQLTEALETKAGLEAKAESIPVLVASLQEEREAQRHLHADLMAARSDSSRLKTQLEEMSRQAEAQSADMDRVETTFRDAFGRSRLKPSRATTSPSWSLREPLSMSFRPGLTRTWKRGRRPSISPSLQSRRPEQIRVRRFRGIERDRLEAYAASRSRSMPLPPGANCSSTWRRRAWSRRSRPTREAGGASTSCAV